MSQICLFRRNFSSRRSLEKVILIKEAAAGRKIRSTSMNLIYNKYSFDSYTHNRRQQYMCIVIAARV